MKRGTHICFGVLAVAGLALVTPPSPAQRMDRDEVLQLSGRIRKAIITLDNYGVFDSVRFRIEPGQKGYQIVLLGYASRPTLKSSAERVVRRIPLVERVDNQMEVLPNSRFDEDVRLQAYLRIYGHPILNRYDPNRGVPIYGLRRRAFLGISQDPPLGLHPVHIIVKNGNIILEGVVDNESDRNLLTMVANGVPGAFTVTNNVEVYRPPKPQE